MKIKFQPTTHTKTIYNLATAQHETQKEPAFLMPRLTKQEQRMVRRLWLKALASGKAKQIAGNFVQKKNKSYAYCGLGVCIPVIKHLTGVRINEDTNIVDKTNAVYPLDIFEVLRRFMGLTSGQVTQVIDWNDDDNLSFKQIAAKFRQKYPKLAA